MNQFFSNKIIAGIVALALLVGVGVLVSSGDTSSTTRNAALVVATPCPKPGQVTKVSKQSVVCAKTNTGSLWYATMKAKGKAQPCTTPGAIRQKSDIVWVCGVIKKKKLWQATQPLTALAAKGDLPSTTPATPDAPVVADNAVLADPAVIDTAATQTLAPAIPAALSLETQPSGGVNALALATQPVVQLLDQRKSSISTAGITITAVSGRTDVVLSGNTAVTDAKGRAIFKTLSLTGIMGDIALTFTAPRLGLEGVTSGNLDLAAGVATALVSDTKLGAVAAGQQFNQFHKLHLEDSSGNVVAGAGRDVNVSSSPEGLYGYTTEATAKDGYVLFKELGLTQTGTTTLTFTSGDLSTTSTVVVKPGDSQGLKITTEVSEAATNNIAFAQSPVVQLLDADGNNVTTAGITVTATITQFSANDTDKTSTPFSSTAVTNAQGVATFIGLGIKGLIGAYTLGFTPAGGVTRASNKTVTLSAGEPKKLIVLTAAAGPVGNSTAGTWSLTQSPVIGLRDISNNEVTKSGVKVTATVTGQDPTFEKVTDDQGKATILVTFSGASAGLRMITYKASNVNDLTADVTLPLLTSVVKTVLTVPTDKNTTSENFQLTAPTSNSGGAWTFTSSPATFATITATGTVTLTGIAGTTTITATQAATTKYASATSTEDLDIALTRTVVSWALAYPLDKNTTSAPFNPTSLPMSNSDGAWTYSTGRIAVCDIGCWSYTNSDTSVVTVDRNSGRVTPGGVAGRVSIPITATQAATTKHAGITSTANLVLDPPPPVPPVVSRALAYPLDNNNTSAPFNPTSLPLSNSDGAWTYASSNPAMTSVDRDSGEVTRTGIAGTVTITATQAATKKYTTITRTATATYRAMRVGETGPGGGTVFYVATSLQPWGAYLEVAPTDYQVTNQWGTDSARVTWGCTGTLTGATGTAIGTGKANTAAILAKCPTAAIAARVAADYQGGGKSDWFLPSRNELNELCKKYSNGRTDTTNFISTQDGCTGNLQPFDGFVANSYWSSSESDANNAWEVSFQYGNRASDGKNYGAYVRPVRAF